jgi:hypothetical protein
MTSNNNRDASDKSKYEIADEIGVDLKHGYNGDLTTKEAGQIGGRIGGQIVKNVFAEYRHNHKI